MLKAWYNLNFIELEEASTHESAKKHAGIIFCALKPRPLTF